TTHVWVDAYTFLEAKIQGQPRRLDGAEHPVEIYFRDYRPVNGLQIPYVLETKVLPVEKVAVGLRDTPVPSEKTTIEKVVLNPGYRGLLVAGYRFVGDDVTGNCSYYTVSGKTGIGGGGAGPNVKHYDQTCRWDQYGNLLRVTPGAPAVPAPISVKGTQVIYAT